MKKFLWFLLIGISFITGTIFAEDVWVPDNVDRTDEPQMVHRKVTITLEGEDSFAMAEIPEAKTPTVGLMLDASVSEIKQKIILANAAIGVINVEARNATDYFLEEIDSFWVPESEMTAHAFMKDQAIDVNTLAVFFETLKGKDDLEIKILKTKDDFMGKEILIRAVISVEGRKIDGPFLFTDDTMDFSTRKTIAVYAAIGQAIADHVGWFRGVWEGETFRIGDSSILFQRFNGQDSTRGTFLGKETALSDYTGTNSGGTYQFRSMVEKLIGFLKKIMVPIAVLLIAYTGLTVFFAWKDEDKMNQKIHVLTGTMIGFLAMTLAVNLVDWVIFGHEGEILSGRADTAEFAKRGLEEIGGVFDMFTSFIAILAVAFIVFNAIFLITSGANDEGKESEIKKRIFYSMMGLILVITIRPLIDVFTINGQLSMPNTRGVISIVAKWLNFILGFIGILAVASMIYAGTLMILHFGDEAQVENAKKIIKYAAIGLVLALSSWAVVYYFTFAGVS